MLCLLLCASPVDSDRPYSDVVAAAAAAVVVVTWHR